MTSAVKRELWSLRARLRRAINRLEELLTAVDTVLDIDDGAGWASTPARERLAPDESLSVDFASAHNVWAEVREQWDQEHGLTTEVADDIDD